MPNLDFEIARNGTVAMVAVSGELDLPGADVLDAELRRLDADAALRAVVLDLRNLAFMDSSGLRLVVVADQRARAADRRFAVIRGPETVHRVFEITRVAERLEFLDDPDEASQ
jgi:anti-anti-sigma factor